MAARDTPTIHSGWLAYAKQVLHEIEPNSTQYIETEKAFHAGATYMMTQISVQIEGSAAAGEVHTIVRPLTEELRRYCSRMIADDANKN